MRNVNDHILFVKVNEESKIFIISIYVNDLIYTRNDECMFGEFKNSMMHEFDMSDIGRIRYLDEGIYICQKNYAMDVRRTFKTDESNLMLNSIISSFKVFKDAYGVKVDFL